MIKLFIMDVDGTLTDGGIYYDDSGHEFKKFNVKDGAGIKKLKDYGVLTMVLTGRESLCVTKRAKELKIDYVIQGVDDKISYLHSFIQVNHFDRNEIAYIGDDINDLKCMQFAGHTAAPADAVEDVLTEVEYICQKKGGQGAVREYAEYLIRMFV